MYALGMEQLHPLEIKAIEIVNIPGWFPYQFECIENALICTGAVCPLIQRGQNKGYPNYRKFDPNTVKKVAIPKIQTPEPPTITIIPE